MSDESGGALTRELVTCPTCGAHGGVPIVRGLPGYEDFLAERRGELVIGGCLAWEGDPEWHCRECGHEWGSQVTTPL